MPVLLASLRFLLIIKTSDDSPHIAGKQILIFAGAFGGSEIDAKPRVWAG